MNQELKQIFDQSMAVLKKDPRVLGAWHFGSLAKNCADQFSDVDPVLLIKSDYFEEIDQELPRIFARFCPKIHLWLGEDFNDSSIKNYAILIETEGLHQYDLTIVKESKVGEGMAEVFSKGCKKENIIFDKDKIVETTLDMLAQGITCEVPNPEQLRRLVEKYWLYAYIFVKYFLRKDLFKMLYLREEMRNVHFSLFKISGQYGLWEWWPESISKTLGAQQQAEILAYFAAPEVMHLGKNFKKMLDLFSKEAKAICQKEKIPYAQSLEDKVLQYIEGKLAS